MAGVELLADLHGRERVGAGVLELGLRQLALVPGADADVVRLLHLHAQHLPHQPLQPGAAEVGLPERARGKAAQVHRARHLQPVPVPQLGRVVADPDPDEGEPAISQEVGQRVGYVVGAEDLEDEAAAVDADLQHGDGARHGRGGAPLHVEADDEHMAAAAVDAVGLLQPRLHLAAGFGERCLEAVLVERHHVGVVVGAVSLDLGRHLARSLSLSLRWGELVLKTEIVRCKWEWLPCASKPVRLALRPCCTAAAAACL